MDLPEPRIAELEAALKRMESLEPDQLPEPAAELVDLLGRILDELEST